MRITGPHGVPTAAGRSRRTAGLLLGVLLALLVPLAALPPGAAAQSSDRVFTVRGIEVDVTADSPTAAREQALAQGQARAMRGLLERLVVPADQGAIPSLSAAEVQDYVLDFGVSDERTSDVQYIATMTVRFRPGAVRRLLRANGLRFAEVQSKPVLVLPIWGEGAQARLWQGANPWRRAWAEVSDVHELVPVLTPLGDLEDLRDIDAAQALAGDDVRLRTLEERYGAGSVLVSHAIPRGDAEVGLGGVQIDSRRYRRGQPDGTFIDSFSQQSGEDETALLERAAQTISAGLQQEWKRANVISFDELQRLRVAVPLDRLQDWLTVRRRLEGLASVAASDLASLTRAQAVVELAFYGSLDQLLGQLEQRDLVLTRTGGGQPPGTGTTVVISGQRPGSTASGLQGGAARQAPAEAPQWQLTTRERTAGDAAPGAVDVEPGAPAASPMAPPAGTGQNGGPPTAQPGPPATVQ